MSGGARGDDLHVVEALARRAGPGSAADRVLREVRDREARGERVACLVEGTVCRLVPWAVFDGLLR